MDCYTFCQIVPVSLYGYILLQSPTSPKKMLRRIKKQRKLKRWTYLCVPRPVPPIPRVLASVAPVQTQKSRPKKLPYKARMERRLERRLIRARLVAPELFALFQIFPVNASNVQIAAAESVWTQHNMSYGYVSATKN